MEEFDLNMRATLRERDAGYLWTDHSFTRLVDNLHGHNGKEGIEIAMIEVKEMAPLMEALLRSASAAFRDSRCGKPKGYSSYCWLKVGHDGKCSMRRVS